MADALAVVIRTKATGTGAPTSLAYGELATDGTDVWVGDKTGTPLKITGGATAWGAISGIPAAIDAIDGLTPAADRLPYYTGAATGALATFTSFGRNLVDDADAAAARTTLGLGTMSTETATNYLGTASSGSYSTSGTVTATGGVIAATNLGMSLSGSNALWTVDANDAWYYNRTTNTFIAQIASTAVWQVSANGPDNGVRRWYAETGSWLSTSDAVPYDNTTPTNAEVADTLLTIASVNPKKTTNKVMIRASGTCTAGAAQGGMFFIFRGTTCIAARAVSIAGAGAQVPWSIDVETTFSATADVTLRYGVISSGTMYVNGTNTAGLFGGVNKTTLEVIEYLTA